MGHGAEAVYFVTMASGGVLTPAIDLGRAFAKVHLEVPTLTSNTQLHIQAAVAKTDVFRRVKQWNVASANVATDYAISSGVTNGIAPIPGGLRYLKVEATATIDNGALFRIICSDS